MIISYETLVKEAKYKKIFPKSFNPSNFAQHFAFNWSDHEDEKMAEIMENLKLKF